MNIETKSFDIKADVIATAPAGTVHAVVSIFKNEDSVRDVMVKGAFAKSIKAGKAKGALPPGVWSHDWQRPIAKTMDAFETDEGLNVIGQFNLETQDGHDAYSNVKNGLFTEYSFGFQRVNEDEKDGVTYVKDVIWYEWSPVLVGANRDTYTVGVKRDDKRFDLSDFPTERHFERWLVAAGLTRSFATIVVSKGYKQQVEVLQREADEATSQEPETAVPTEPEPKPDEPSASSETPQEAEKQEPNEAPVIVAPTVVNVRVAAHQERVQALYANFLTQRP